MLRTKEIRELFKNTKISNNMLEILGTSFIADEESIFGSVNYEYVNIELNWYKSQSRNINDLEFIPKIWKQIASQEGLINSNYGWCIFNSKNFHQYKNVIEELRNNPNSRRACMIYTRPSIHYEFDDNGMNDFICTNAVNYFIRDNKISCVVQMRSNDAVYGYKNDRAWQLYVLKLLALELSIEIGDIIWNAASLHIYKRHFGLVDDSL